MKGFERRPLGLKSINNGIVTLMKINCSVIPAFSVGKHYAVASVNKDAVSII